MNAGSSGRARHRQESGQAARLAYVGNGSVHDRRRAQLTAADQPSKVLESSEVTTSQRRVA